MALLLGVLGQITIFSYTGEKAVLASSLLVIGIWILAQSKNLTSRTASVVPMALAGVVSIAVLADVALQSQWGASLVVRRGIATPGLMTGYYVDFFSNNPHPMLGQHLLGSFVEYPYGVPISQLVGLGYCREPGASANANFLASGFAEWGYPGMTLAAFLLGWFFYAFDAATARIDRSVAMAFLGPGIVSLLNSALQTCLLTHGLLALLVTVSLSQRVFRVRRQTRASSIERS